MEYFTSYENQGIITGLMQIYKPGLIIGFTIVIAKAHEYSTVFLFFTMDGINLDQLLNMLSAVPAT